MRGLIYCREPEVKEPYFARETGLSLYSAEELSYYIVNYVLLLPEDFISERLYRFLGRELGLAELEGKLRHFMKQDADMYQGLFLLVKELRYYSDEELMQFRDELDGIRSAGPLELLRQRGDFFLDVRQYGNAVHTYDQILRESPRDESFAAEVWHNRGVACVQLMQYEEAMDCFVRAWRVLSLDSIAREIFVLYWMEPEHLALPEDVRASVPGETQYRIKEELTAFTKNAAYMGKAEEIAQAFSKDVIRRREAVSSLIREWKQEYREMAG